MKSSSGPSMPMESSTLCLWLLCQTELHPPEGEDGIRTHDIPIGSPRPPGPALRTRRREARRPRHRAHAEVRRTECSRQESNLHVTRASRVVAEMPKGRSGVRAALRMGGERTRAISRRNTGGETASAAWPGEHGSAGLIGQGDGGDFSRRGAALAFTSVDEGHAATGRASSSRSRGFTAVSVYGSRARPLRAPESRLRHELLPCPAARGHDGRATVTSNMAFDSRGSESSRPPDWQRRIRLEPRRVSQRRIMTSSPH